MVSTPHKPKEILAPNKNTWLKTEWLSILVVFILMRLILSAAAAAVLWNTTPNRPVWMTPDHPSLQAFAQTAADPSPAARILLNGWFRWDTGYFVKIGLSGYAAQDGSLSFMPLYPLLIRLLWMLTGANALLLAMLISNLLCLAALILFYEVALLELGSPAAAWDAFLFLITFPATFFLFAGYTESLLMVLALGMWLLARRGRMPWAAFAAALAVLTRMQGAALAVPLGWQALASQLPERGLTPPQEFRAVLRFFIARPLARGLPVLGAVLPPLLALLLYSAGLQVVGLPSIFGAYASRDSSMAWPWVGAAEFIQRVFSISYLPSDIVDLALVMLVIALALAGISKVRPALTLYTLAVLVMVFSRSYPANLLSGFMRFALTTFPIFLVMAGLGLKKPVKNLVLVVFFILQLFLFWMFINWMWVA